VLLAGVALPLTAWGQEPGLTVAAPRFAISTVDDVTVVFHPANLAIEQGDWGRWVHTSTAQTPVFHTTTHGVRNALGGCDPLGLWDAPLSPPDFPQFTRQFLEPPQTLPYCCEPHTILGMLGTVKVTTPIQVTATYQSGAFGMSWTGGGGLYRIFRSDNPRFTGSGTQTFNPNGGDGGTTYTDFVDPDRGATFFYLTMNLF
jgi:plastocyanin